jgi:hypothetical protein
MAALKINKNLEKCSIYSLNMGNVAICTLRRPFDFLIPQVFDRIARLSRSVPF